MSATASILVICALLQSPAAYGVSVSAAPQEAAATFRNVQPDPNLTEENDVFRPIGKYMAGGDAKSLSAWFAPCLEISVLGHTNQASRSQATQILKNFFSTYKPGMFNIVHKAVEGNFRYALCDLTASGEHFRVTVSVSCRRGESYMIQQINIERM